MNDTESLRPRRQKLFDMLPAEDATLSVKSIPEFVERISAITEQWQDQDLAARESDED